ncbi:MAG: Gfo/Idh/MocA family oxidoreductase [Armatimonadetes bacterium]|nr:Gfo/Idh/MocA family oxidoreductase [Armatimonadota bacterium]
MPRMSVGVGIVGYGAQFSMGKHHSDSVKATEGLELAGIYDIEPERRTAAREEQGVAVFDSYEGLVAELSIGLVVLVTPHDTHAPLSIQASRAGKHVMTEKAMCLNTKEADSMIAAAKEAGKTLTVYQNRRWDGDFLTVKMVLESGAVGRVFQVESSVNGWWYPAGWRGIRACGGGMLYDWGAHLVDQIVQLILPAMPKIVFAVSHAGAHDVDIETQSTVTVLFDNGVSAEIDVGCMSHIARPRWLIRGDKAAFHMPDWKHATLKDQGGEVQIGVEEDRWADLYKNLSRHLNYGEELAVKPEQSRTVMAVIDAAFASAETGKSVAIGND